MKKLLFTASVQSNDKVVMRANLDIFFFREGNNTIAYCPALDLSAAGNNIAQSKSEFAQVFAEYADDCIENNTLKEDLLAHGWVLQGNEYQSPSVTQMLIGNSTLREIIDTKNYQKRVVSFPTECNVQTPTFA